MGRRSSKTSPAALLVLLLCCPFTLPVAVIWWLALSSARPRPASSLLWREVDLLSGEEFEHYVAEILRRMGYAVVVTPKSNDKGVDLIAERGTERIAIQAKRYSSSVSRHAVSDAVAGMRLYHCNRSMVITNSTFSKGAQELARANNCTLVDRAQLMSWKDQLMTRVPRSVPADRGKVVLDVEALKKMDRRNQ